MRRRRRLCHHKSRHVERERDAREGAYSGDARGRRRDSVRSSYGGAYMPRHDADAARYERAMLMRYGKGQRAGATSAEAYRHSLCLCHAALPDDYYSVCKRASPVARVSLSMSCTLLACAAGLTT